MALPTGWPRTILPRTSTAWGDDSALMHRSHSGAITTRAATQRGKRWEETYFFKTDSTNGRELMAAASYFYRSGNPCFINQYINQTINGAAVSNALVAGTNQTGATLAIEAASANVTGWLVVGDCFYFGTTRPVFTVLDDVNTDGAGDAELHLTPPIISAPASGASVQVFFASIGRSREAYVENLEMPDVGPNAYGVMRAMFVEKPQ